jgi:bacterioferritin-associated ferredoxin
MRIIIITFKFNAFQDRIVIVCICANVSDRTISEAVRSGCASVEDITMKTGACSGCGQCRMHCQSELDAHTMIVQVSELSQQTA